ncbi:MAG: NRAMP family divalent metal transporter [Bdellovibrionota bacterium]
MSTPPNNSTKPHISLRKRVTIFFGSLGPGLVSGAADDDPSGIGTYSSAGALLGTSLLWTALLTWPLMSAVQMMCARIGMVSGEGLAAGLKKIMPRPLLIAICWALFIANTLNVGADLAAMADAVELLTGFSSHASVFLFGIGIAIATIRLRYSQIARVLKWLALVLFSYIITTLIIGPDWHSALHDTFVPSLPQGKIEWAMLVAILGTTISPYLFFWQASQEVEEEKCLGRDTIQKRSGASPHEILARKIDVGVGAFFSNLVMYFIILATALTLHKHGIFTVESSGQAAAALRPLAGNFATALYTLGLIGTGLLAVPTLTGSAAYALAETFNWQQGLDMTLFKAKAFYLVIFISTVFAIVIDFADFNPIKALFYSAVLNGLLAPFLLLGILLVASNRKLMNNQPSSKLGITIVALTTILMFGAAGAMFLQ